MENIYTVYGLYPSTPAMEHGSVIDISVSASKWGPVSHREVEN